MFSLFLLFFSLSFFWYLFIYLFILFWIITLVWLFHIIVFVLRSKIQIVWKISSMYDWTLTTSKPWFKNHSVHIYSWLYTLCQPYSGCTFVSYFKKNQQELIVKANRQLKKVKVIMTLSVADARDICLTKTSVWSSICAALNVLHPHRCIWSLVQFYCVCLRVYDTRMVAMLYFSTVN
jgi:hypothetical protein